MDKHNICIHDNHDAIIRIVTAVIGRRPQCYICSIINIIITASSSSSSSSSLIILAV